MSTIETDVTEAFKYRIVKSAKAYKTEDGLLSVVIVFYGGAVCRMQTYELNGEISFNSKPGKVTLGENLRMKFLNGMEWTAKQWRRT